MSAETHYLDALEALDDGRREDAKAEAKKATDADPEHLEAWGVFVDACLPAGGQPPSMIEAAQAIAGIRRILALDPIRMDMWVRGGRILADELGMLHDALHWWQDCRQYAPDEVTPIVEMASILADMGEYSKAQERLQSILDENMDVGMTQFRKINSLLQLVRAAATQQEKEIFRPYEKHHDGWQAIAQKMRKPPMSENFIFLITTVPVLLLVIYFSSQFASGGWGPFCLNTVAIMFIVLLGIRNAKRWFQIINRPAFNLLRAMNFEAATGYTVIPEDMRTSVLYVYIMQRKPLAWQERTLKVIEKGSKLPKNWKLRLPDFEAHIDENAEHPIWSDEALDAYEEE